MVVVVVKLDSMPHDVRAIIVYVEIRGYHSRLPPVASQDAAVLGFCF